MHHSNNRADFVLGAFVGAAVATLTTLLFTTKKGAQLKDKFVEKCHDLEQSFSEMKNKAEDAAHHVKNKVEETAQDAKKGAQKLKKDE